MPVSPSSLIHLGICLELNAISPLFGFIVPIDKDEMMLGERSWHATAYSLVGIVVAMYTASLVCNNL
jgi:hypothetical protein